MSDQKRLTISLVNRFCDALENGDLDALNACFHPAARIWHNSDQKFATVQESSAGTLYYFENFVHRAYGTRRIEVLAKGALLQFIVSLATADGRTFEWPGCVVFEIDQEKIMLLEEYIDLSSMLGAVG